MLILLVFCTELVTFIIHVSLALSAILGLFSLPQILKQCIMGLFFATKEVQTTLAKMSHIHATFDKKPLKHAAPCNGSKCTRRCYKHIIFY